DHGRADLRHVGALLHEGLALVDDILATLRHGRGDTAQEDGKNDEYRTEHATLLAKIGHRPLNNQPRNAPKWTLQARAHHDKHQVHRLIPAIAHKPMSASLR